METGDIVALAFAGLSIVLLIIIALWWNLMGKTAHYRRVIAWSKGWEALTGERGGHHEYRAAVAYFERKSQKRGK